MEKVTGKKMKMTQVWKDENVIPVTVIKYVPTASENKDEPAELPFKEGELVKVTGTAKGRGFQGGVKRHGFHGGPKTHGQKNRHRAPGSIGSTAPQRVLPGRRMAGHMGTNKVTIKNLKVIEIQKDKSLLFLAGAVPGMKGSKIVISR